MKAKDVMTADVISVAPDTPVGEVAKLLVDHGISGAPVIEAGKLLGIVSEGDLVHRAELGTESHRRRWFEVLVSDPARLAKEYVHAHGRTARDVMTREVATINPETSLEEIANILEAKQIKRLPVVEKASVVGIVSRANLVRALAASPPSAAQAPANDDAIQRQLRAALQAEEWSRTAYVSPIVTDGVVHLWGRVDTDAQRRAMELAAEAVPGVKRVENHLRVTPHRPYAG